MPIFRFNYLSQKSFNLTVRSRQLLNRNKTSFPYLSGDAFANACDISLYGNKVFSEQQIANAHSIFCPSERLEEFLNTYGNLIKAEVLIFGNSDRDFFELDTMFPPSVKAVYLQNSHVSNGFFNTLPIGIENLRLGRNGQKSLFKGSVIDAEKNQKILVGPFSPTHNERLELNVWTKIQHPRLYVQSEHLKPKSLASLASTFKFIACPRGNGTDTHRFWESLYRGSIPVVKRSVWSQSMNDLGIPLLELNAWDYDEFLERSEAMASTQINPKQIETLWMGHWKKLINSDSE